MGYVFMGLLESGLFEKGGGPVVGRGGQVLVGGDAVGHAVRGEERAKLLVEGAGLGLAPLQGAQDRCLAQRADVGVADAGEGALVHRPLDRGHGGVGEVGVRRRAEDPALLLGVSDGAAARERHRAERLVDIKTHQDIEKAFAAGAKMVTIGSIAVTEPRLFYWWLQKYGPDRVILGADVRNGKISINGWTEDSEEDLLPFLQKYVDAGVINVLCTEISKDGTLTGPAIDLYREVMNAYPNLHLIASGGVSSIDDIKALDAAGIPAVVFGKAIYEGKIDLEELRREEEK